MANGSGSGVCRYARGGCRGGGSTCRSVDIRVGSVRIALGFPFLELRVVCLAGYPLGLADPRHSDSVSFEGRFQRRGGDESVPLCFFAPQIGIELHLARFFESDFLRDGFAVVLQDCIDDADDGRKDEKECERGGDGPGMLCLAINPIPVCFPSSMGCDVSFHSSVRKGKGK